MSYDEKTQENSTSEKLQTPKGRCTKGLKAGFDIAWNAFEKLGAPVNRLTNKIGSEAFWPQSLDKESNKAARILKSFCHDGFYNSKIQPPNYDGPKSQSKVLVKIPRSVIQDCVGLAIFSTMRAGLWVSGAGGSGVLIARLPDGSWSPPSGILVHTLGVGFNMGIDIYDCVVVINNYKALEAFSKLRVTLGAEVSAAVGPVGAGGVLDANIDPRREKAVDRTPVYTYMKSRGLYAGVQIDGTFIIERNDENARFYGERLPVTDILAGRVQNVPAGLLPLMEVAKAAEGRMDFDHRVVEDLYTQPPPSDVEVERQWEASEKEKEAYAREGPQEATQ
jgi:lipid-binding SYLF domain-containing protein